MARISAASGLCARTCTRRMNPTAQELSSGSAMPRPCTVTSYLGTVARGRPSLEAGDDAQVAVRAVAEYAQRLLICGTVVRGGCLLHAVELDEHAALLEAAFVHDRGQSARQDAAAAGLQGRSCELGVRRQCLRVADRAVQGDPICLGHTFPECREFLPHGPRATAAREVLAGGGSLAPRVRAVPWAAMSRTTSPTAAPGTVRPQTAAGIPSPGRQWRCPACASRSGSRGTRRRRSDRRSARGTR